MTDIIPVPQGTLGRVQRLQAEVSKLPQYEPKTRHFFHGGMYCREVWRDKGILVVGNVHKKEHFYLIVSGTVLITSDDAAELKTGPALILSKAGTKRAVYSKTPTLCMTFHRCNATTIAEAEAELTEDDPSSMFLPGNLLPALEGSASP